MTKDLALCVSGGKEVTKEFYMYTEDYIEKVAEILAQEIKKGFGLARM